MDVVARLRAAGCVFAEDEAALLGEVAAGDQAELEQMLRRRVAGEPIEYIVGWAQFRGRRYVVDTGVFVPRHRSELLVERVLAIVRSGMVVVDLCCGCGALGAAVQAEVDIDLHAADIDPAAVRCARRNVLGSVYEGDLFDALPGALRGQVDVLLLNAPYVPTAAIALLPPEFRQHEARVALDGGIGGTDVQERVLAGVGAWLAPGAALLTETSQVQGERLLEIAADAGFRGVLASDDQAETWVLQVRR